MILTKAPYTESTTTGVLKNALKKSRTQLEGKQDSRPAQYKRRRAVTLPDPLPASQSLRRKRRDPESPVFEPNIFIEVAASKKHESVGPELHSYRSHFFDYIAQKATERHEKPILNEYHEDLKALGRGRKDAHPGNVEPYARVKLQAGLKAVEPAIASSHVRMT